MAKRKSLTRQIQEALQAKLRPGDKKHEDKRKNNNKPAEDKLYSYQTFEDYMRSANVFKKWAVEKYHCRDLPDLRPHAEEWLAMRAETVAPSTINQDAYALAKLFGVPRKTLIENLPPRYRKDFRKNRTDAWKGHYSKETHQNITVLSEGVGVRRHEMVRLCRSMLVREGDRLWFKQVKGKGGKLRDIPVRHGYEDKILAMVAKAEAAGRDRLLAEKIPKDAPIHDDRGRSYAQGLYAELARPIDQLSRKEIYYGRKDMKGRRWDKVAMMTVSEALGHSRHNVVTNYFR